MKRLLTSTIAALAIVSFTATSCGIAEPDVAATVNGHEISLKAVDDLAGTDYIAQVAEGSGVGLVSSPPGAKGSAKQRLALSLLVQGQVFSDGIASRKGKITSIDQQAAEEQLSGYEDQNGQLEPAVREFFRSFLATQAALGRILGGSDIEQAATPDKIEAYFDEHADEFVQVCLDGFAVQASSTAAAQAAVDRGDPVTTILADATLAAQPLSQDGGETCVMTTDVTNPQLTEPVTEGAIGEWSTATISDPQNGDVTVFIRPNSRGPLTLADQTVVATVTKALEDEATAVAQEQFQGESVKILEGAEVEVNPQYGSWNPDDQALIVAPPVPTSKIDVDPSAIPLAGQ